MPVIFSSSLLALPTALARYANWKPVEAVAAALNPSGPLYLPVGSLLSLLLVSTQQYRPAIIRNHLFSVCCKQANHERHSGMANGCGAF